MIFKEQKGTMSEKVIPTVAGLILRINPVRLKKAIEKFMGHHEEYAGVFVVYMDIVYPPGMAISHYQTLEVGNLGSDLPYCISVLAMDIHKATLDEDYSSHHLVRIKINGGKLYIGFFGAKHLRNRTIVLALAQELGLCDEQSQDQEAQRLIGVLKEKNVVSPS